MFLGINFIGISYIIVYVGAIAVLFLFIIMMINIKLEDIIDTGSQYTKTLPLGLLVVSLFTYIFYIVIPFMFNEFNDTIFYIIDLIKLSNNSESACAFKTFNNINLFNSLSLLKLGMVFIGKIRHLLSVRSKIIRCSSHLCSGKIYCLHKKGVSTKKK